MACATIPTSAGGPESIWNFGSGVPGQPSEPVWSTVVWSLGSAASESMNSFK